MFKRLRLRERAIQYLLKLSNSTPLDNRLVALEADVAKVQRSVSSRTREEVDFSLLVAKVSALQTRVDVISNNVAALRSEVVDASTGRHKARQEQLDDAISTAVRSTNESIDARVNNLLSLLNAAQTASLAQIGQILIGQHAVEARLATLEGRTASLAGPEPATLLSNVVSLMDGKVNNLLDVLNAAQASLLDRVGEISVAQHAVGTRLALLEAQGVLPPGTGAGSLAGGAATLLESKINNLLDVMNDAQAAMLDQVGQLAIAQQATEARLGVIEVSQAGLPTAMNEVQAATLKPVGQLSAAVHALEARLELLAQAQQQGPEVLNRMHAELLRMIGEISVDLANMKHQLQLVGETGLTRPEHELATGNLMKLIETAQQAGLDLQTQRVATVSAAIEEARQAFQKDMLRFQQELVGLRAEIAALRNRAKV